MLRADALRSIVLRCSELHHDMGGWEITSIDGFPFLRSACRHCHATVFAETDGRLVPGGAATSVPCLPIAVRSGRR